MKQTKIKNAEVPAYIRRFVNKKSLKWLKLLAGGFLLWMLIGYISAYYATKPASCQVYMDKKLQAYPHQSVTIETKDNIKISAWLIGEGNTTAIILTGIKGNRMANVDRALLYLERGHTVLLPDLRATGESEGDVISFGWHEQQDVVACYQYLKKIGKTKVGLHGSSLGAAAITYALDDISEYSFVVLESPYDKLESAIHHRMEPFLLPKWVYSPMLWMGEWVGAISIGELKPVEAIRHCKAPLLYFAGDSERVLKLTESRSIFENCPAKNKVLHIFKGGKHQDFLKGFTIEYIQVWEQFMDKKLVL